MATPESQVVPRKARTRARAPKVRTGCITCKIRHLKCDEGKPVCQRCIKDKQKCDGYEQLKAPNPKAKKPLRLVQFQPKSNDAACRALAALRPAPSIGNLACPIDAALFYHAREYTIKDFDAISCSKFWQDFVLPSADVAEPVKYALCALGGAHRRFLTGYQGDPACSPIAAEYEVASIQKYNEAIMRMKPLMLDNSDANLQTTLICCIIFICIENLHGRYTDSIRHLHAGCQLLNSLRAERGLKSSPTSSSNSEETSDPENSLFVLVSEMFWRLGQNVAIYVGDDIFLDLNLPARTFDMADPQAPFPSLTEADRLLDHVDDIYNDFLLASSPEKWLIQKSYVHTSSSNFVFDARKSALSAARATFAVWNSRFELLVNEARNSRLSPEEQRQLAFLSLHQAIWGTLTKLETIEEEFEREDSEIILDRAEQLIQMETDKTNPVFAFNGYLIPALSIVCSSCRDVDVSNRAISLLRSFRRREGIWDSHQIADVYEAMLAARTQNIVDWDTLPWGIPHLAAELSSLNLSETSNSSPSPQLVARQGE